MHVTCATSTFSIRFPTSFSCSKDSCLEIVTFSYSKKHTQLTFRCRVLPRRPTRPAVVDKLSADKKLIEVLETEIRSAMKPKDVRNLLPSRSPFKIVDNDGEKCVFMKREIKDELVEIELETPNTQTQSLKLDGTDYGDEEYPVEACIPAIVRVSKPSGKYLEFYINIVPTSFAICGLTLRDRNVLDDEHIYLGPDFVELNDKLRDSFHKYLEARGIVPSNTDFLFTYLLNKDRKEYCNWLSRTRSFIDA